MITFVRTVSVAPGKTADAMAFAHAIAKLIKEKVGSDLRINVPIGGNPNRIAFVTVYASLSEFEAVSTKLVADADYLKIVATNASNFLPGSVFDEIWRGV